MTTDAIREVMHKAIPFDLKTADGSVYAVKHPDFVSVGTAEDDVVVVHTDSGLAILALASITAIELTHRAPAA
jgi:hypothetical protein